MRLAQSEGAKHLKRIDGRGADELRPVRITRNYQKYAEGSVLFQLGDTWVVCAASVDDKVPPFLHGKGQGWITAEYSMLPRSTSERTKREAAQGRVGGRTHEIQRLIGRSLRSVVDLAGLGGERTIWLDCDVLQADGGTRTAAISGAFVALYDALRFLVGTEKISDLPVKDFVAATSVGIIEGEPVLDLCFEEDSAAETDMNLVMDGSGGIIEIQGTAEKQAFSQDELDTLLELAKKGIAELVSAQRDALGEGPGTSG